MAIFIVTGNPTFTFSTGIPIVRTYMGIPIVVAGLIWPLWTHGGLIKVDGQVAGIVNPLPGLFSSVEGTVLDMSLEIIGWLLGADKQQGNIWSTWTLLLPQ